MFVLVLTGPPGAGKSSVLEVVQDALGDAGIANALVEVDELERCHPPLPRELAMAHVAMLAGSFRAAGYRVLLITVTLDDEAYRDALLEAAGPGRRLLVRLEAEPDTLERRIRARERPGWSGLSTLVDSSRRLAESMRSLGDVDLVMSTEGERAEAVGARVLAVLMSHLPAAHRRQEQE